MVNPLVFLTLSKSCKMKTTIWTLIAAGTVFDSFIDCLRSKLSVHDEITCKIMTEPDGETKISRTWDRRITFFTSARKFDPELVI